MTQARLLALASVCMFALVAQLGKPIAHQLSGATSATVIAQAVRGRTCTTPSGAKFSFGKDGEYAYDGLWKSDGHYKIHPGVITITLHSGLERSFVISSRAGSLFFENTSVTCTAEAATAHAH